MDEGVANDFAAHIGLADTDRFASAVIAELRVMPYFTPTFLANAHSKRVVRLFSSRYRPSSPLAGISLKYASSRQPNCLAVGSSPFVVLVDTAAIILRTHGDVRRLYESAHLPPHRGVGDSVEHEAGRDAELERAAVVEGVQLESVPLILRTLRQSEPLGLAVQGHSTENGTTKNVARTCCCTRKSSNSWNNSGRSPRHRRWSRP